MRSQPANLDRERSGRTHDDAVDPRVKPANTSLMIVDDRSPLDFYFKELDNQPFPYYLTSIIFIVAV